MGLAGRVVVVSPHLDDAVFSLGATIARATRSGARVEVLTVFAGDPASATPAGGWDRRAGFATEGEAAAARRAEDREATRLVGAEPSWLPFSTGGYVKARDEKRDGDAISAAVGAAIAGADAALVPGFPLTNEDHAWLTRLLLDRPPGCGRLALYAEQPYRYKVRGERKLGEGSPTEVEWTPMGRRVGEYERKRRAILAYASQLPMLGLTARKLRMMLLHEALHRGEALAWLPER